MNAIELGKFIANLRNEKHLTQEDLAEKLFIDKRKISRWECGTSIPEFEMIIKLSEILDVSLYELSICKKIKNERIDKRIINKFNSIKDLRNYNIKRKIKYILGLLLLIFFIKTTIYTFKNYGTVEIYELKSLDENYFIYGNYFNIKNNIFFNIKQISIINNNEKEIIKTENCNYEIYNNSKRLIYSLNNDNKENNILIYQYFDVIKSEEKINDTIKIHIVCNDSRNTNEYNFSVKLKKLYDNKL